VSGCAAAWLASVARCNGKSAKEGAPAALGSRKLFASYKLYYKLVSSNLQKSRGSRGFWIFLINFSVSIFPLRFYRVSHFLAVLLQEARGIQKHHRNMFRNKNLKTLKQETGGLKKAGSR
jgi:hypothetical protein